MKSIFSQRSLLEISIKQRIDKLSTFYVIVEEIFQQAISDGFTFLSIQNKHIFNYIKIPLVEDNCDPFGRLLIATALAEDAVIISADEKLFKYPGLVKML